MKTIFAVLAFAVLASGCATSPSTPPTPETPRVPASTEINALKDKYGDAMVFFCTDTTAIVTIDPNKCGEARAKGAHGCTELAGYTSDVLKVDQQGKNTDLLSEDGKVVFTMKPNNKGVILTGVTRFSQKPMAMTWEKITDSNRLAQVNYYCNPR